MKNVCQILPPPGRILMTPEGNPAYTLNSANFSAVRGHTWAGFKTTVFPAAKQAAIFQATIMRG